MKPAAAAIALLLAACSSGGPSRPAPPVVVPTAQACTLTLRWDAVTAATDGTPLADVSTYTLAIVSDAGVRQMRTYTAAGTYTLELEPGRYRLELTATSPTLGASDPSSAVFAESTSAANAVSRNPCGFRE